MTTTNPSSTDAAEASNNTNDTTTTTTTTTETNKSQQQQQQNTNSPDDSSSSKQLKQQNSQSIQPRSGSKRKSDTPHHAEPPRKKISKPMILYKPTINLFSDYKPNTTIKVWIDRSYLLRASSYQQQKIYGTDVYVDESDLIAVIQHMGWIHLDDVLRRPQSLRGVVATVKVLDPNQKDLLAEARKAASEHQNNQKKDKQSDSEENKQQNDSANKDKDASSTTEEEQKTPFISSYRNKIRSRSWLKTDQATNAFTVINCQVIRDVLVGEHVPDDVINSPNSVSKLSREQLEHQRFLPDVTVVYNLSNEPVFKYNLKAVSDEGFEPKQFTSYKLLSKVLYVESKTNRYELSLNESSKKFTWSEVTQDPLKLELAREERPLSNDKVKVLHSDLNWNEIVWSVDSVEIRKDTYPIVNVQWLSRSKPIDDSAIPAAASKEGVKE